MSVRHREEFELSCLDCATSSCAKAKGDYPAFCPTKAMTEQEKVESVQAYRDDELALSVMRAASATGARAFSDHLCRVEEIMDFCRRMGYRKIGVAACSGLAAEARLFAKVLRVHGFEVYGIACKVGAVSRASLEAAESCCDFGLVSCNPLMQAKMLNEADVDINVVIGLCVGHDALFYKHADAPCTTLVTKDRALANNAAAVFQVLGSASPYSRLLKEDESFSPLGEGAVRQESKSCC